jgi:hypothetical protein
VNPTEIKIVRKPKSEELEIEFTLESGLVCDFVPDFKLSTNYADETQVSWRLSDKRSSNYVGNVFPSIQIEKSILSSRSSRDDL